MQELFANEQFTGKQFLRVKIERRITILCEEHFHIGPQVHKMDRSISKLLEARVKAEGLDEVTLMHGWILRYLYEHQDAEIYQKDIEKYFGICRSGVTNIIQALEKKGLVCRASVASDARLKKVMLTEAGRESHEKLGEIFKRMDAELEEGITEEELQAFLRVTHKGSSQSKKNERREFMIRTLLKEVKEYKTASIATPIFMILEVLFETLIPFLMASIIDKGVNTGDIHHIYKVGGIMIVAAFFRPACRNGGRTLWSKGFYRFRKEFEKCNV